jgi:exodeoxyribonuclease I
VSLPFVFYDSETTGLSAEFDQVLQFGAIRTDANLSELERFEIRCRIQQHVVPSPQALLVTGISPESLTDPSLPSHYEAMQTIERKMREWGPSAYVGYNSINFDEKFLRQAFYQSLLPIYGTNTNRNIRGDVLNIVHGAYIHAPQSIKVPRNEKGNLTFKLDRLAPENGHKHENAHDAMADVEATIHMCEIIKRCDASLWRELVATMSKQRVIQLCEDAELVHYTTSYFGRVFHYVLKLCGESDGVFVGFDLSRDPAEFVDHTVDQIVADFGASRKSLRRFYPNQHPILIPMSSEDAALKLPGLTKDDIQHRIVTIDKNSRYLEGVQSALKIISAQKDKDKSEEEPYLEREIHGGALANSDAGKLIKFKQAEGWGSKLAIANGFDDLRFKEIAYRLAYQSDPNVLPNTILDQMRQWHLERVMSNDPSVPWMTVPKALLILDGLEENADPSTKRQLLELREFYEGLASNASQLEC